MRAASVRKIFTISRNRNLWAVEHDGEYFDHTLDMAEARASANKRARQAQDAGHPCQVKVTGRADLLS